MVSKPAVIGIDIGADTAFVGYAHKGLVEIVQNEVSSRTTPSLVGFTSHNLTHKRLLGDEALSLIKSNTKNSCRNFKHLLGRKIDAPDLEIEKFWSTCPLAKDSDGFAGYDVSYKDERRVFSASEVTAMFLTKLKEVTEAWTKSKVADVVIAVPSCFADQQRQALLDAAEIAGLHVLKIMNEHTATALAYGIYRSNDFDPEKPQNVVFCNLGHSMFSVSVVAFMKGKLQIICEYNDKVGGRDMDQCLMNVFAAEFKKKHNLDIFSNQKASFRMEDAVGKTKKILSANDEAPVSVECLMEDEDFESNIQRDDFEKMCEPMMDRVRNVLNKAKEACDLSADEIHCVEVTGGASRVPWFKKMCSEAFYGKELSTTLNADECVARGCTLQAAILSPLFKVRDFKVEDTSPFSVSVGWMGTAAEGETKDEDEAGATPKGAGSGQMLKTADVFPAGSVTNLLKMLTFYQKGPFDIKAQYTETDILLAGTKAELGTYRINLPEHSENKKVKVKVKLTQHGTFTIESAQMIEEEEYEETVKEKRELPPNGNAEGDAKEKEYEWVEVKKMKKKTKRTDLEISCQGRLGLDKSLIQKRKDAEFTMQAEMREIIETNEAKNDLESYFLTMRDKILEGNQYGDFVSSTDRDTFSKMLMAAEDWLNDHGEGTKDEFVKKLAELKKFGNPIVWRYTEDHTRADWIAAVEGTIANYRTAAVQPGEKYGHIATEKLNQIIQECDDLPVWLNDLKKQQAEIPKCQRPVLLCAELEKRNTALARMADKILTEKKPEPDKKENPKEEVQGA